MAGDWIPIRCTIHDDPAVIAIATATGLDEHAVVGRLVKLWAWANEHTTDGNVCNAPGNAPSVTGKWIDRHVGRDGFAAAMAAAGWLVLNPTGVVFPNFERWNPQSAKRRALTAKRVAAHRAKSNAPGNAPSVTGALPEKRREEKRREKDTTPPPPSGSAAVAIPPELDTEAFRQAWGEWKAHRRTAGHKAYKPRGEAQQLKHLAKFGPLVALAAIEESTRQGWQGLFPEKIKHHDAATAGRPGPGVGRVGRAPAVPGKYAHLDNPAGTAAGGGAAGGGASGPAGDPP